MRRSYPVDDTLTHISYMTVGPLGVEEGPERERTGAGSCGDLASFFFLFSGRKAEQGTFVLGLGFRIEPAHDM